MTKDTRALENVALLADILNRRPAMNAGLPEAYAQWTSEVYQLMGSMAAEPANDTAPKPTMAEFLRSPFEDRKEAMDKVAVEVEREQEELIAYVDADRAMRAARDAEDAARYQYLKSIAVQTADPLGPIFSIVIRRIDQDGVWGNVSATIDAHIAAARSAQGESK